MIRGISTASGVSVTPLTALGVTTVYACVNRISGTVASVPLKLYRALPGGGKEPANKHPLYHLLHDSPNPEMTSVDFRRTVQAQLSLRNNGYALIVRNGLGEVIELQPINPSDVSVSRTDGNGPVVYSIGGEQYPAEKVIHLRNLSSNGITGLDTISVARESIALAVALHENAARFFGNGCRPGGILESDFELDAEQQSHFREQWNKLFSSKNKGQHKLAILAKGMRYISQRMDNDAAQFLESRKQQAIEICQVFGVPPHKVGILDKATFSNIEEQNIEYVVDTILPQLRVWEQTLNMRLLTERERGEYFFEFNVEGLLRGDIGKRYAAYAIGRQWGWLSSDEIRERENMNPLPDDKGKIYLEPMNMREAGTNDDEKNKTQIIKDTFETYGAAIRAGLITPQIDDEEALRAKLGLPAVNADARTAWAERDKGARRPITISGARDLIEEAQQAKAPTEPSQPSEPPSGE